MAVALDLTLPSHGGETKVSSNQRVRPVLTVEGDVEYVPTLTQEVINVSKAIVPSTVAFTAKGWDKTKGLASKIAERFHKDEEVVA